MLEAPPGFIPLGDRIVNVRHISSVIEAAEMRFDEEGYKAETGNSRAGFAWWQYNKFNIPTGKKYVTVSVGDLKTMVMDTSLVQFIAKMQAALTESQ